MPSGPGPVADAGQEPRRLQQLIAREAAAAGLQLPGGAAAALALHLAMTLRWNRAMSLTAITDPGEAVRRHVLESVQAAAHVRPEAGGLLDIGSGNGYPALPIKVLHRHLDTTLLEPALRKSVFLESAVRAAGLEGVRVRRERVERPSDLERYPGTGNISMRAVAVIDQVLEGAARILPAGGRLILLVGASQAEALCGSASSPLLVAARVNLPFRPGGALLVLERS